MQVDDYTVGSRSRIKRFSHEARLRKAVALLAPRPRDRILDYGAGSGSLLKLLGEVEPAVELFGYEPVHLDSIRENIGALCNLRGLSDSIDEILAFRPNKIACLELLEHLRPEDLDSTVASFTRLLEPGGRVVVSVPVEIGPASLFKNVVRKLVNQPHRGITPRNVLLSLVGMAGRIPRDLDEPYIASHIGFDYRSVERITRRHGFRVKRSYSPVPFLGPLAASQVFFVLVRCGGSPILNG